MKKIFIGLAFMYLTSMATELPPLPPDLGPFTGLEMTVGYIQKENGEKFFIVETPEGTRLIKTKELPKKDINPKVTK